MREVISLNVKIVQIDKQEFKFNTDGKLPLFEKFSFYPARNEINTPDAVLKNLTSSDQSKDGEAIGPWKGTTFNYKRINQITNEGDGTSVTFTFGKRISDKTPFIYYRASIIQDGTPIKNEEIICFVSVRSRAAELRC